ncbi:MAG: ATP-binding cassette domain-containing protein [Rhodospirillaceae bacterium]|jgi:sodium transport system ATP-binding protein|nr:ATP-binding cassette domain-containing protein [Rhodospirillales bacterium]MBT3904704.1 ATP-binding cassette domain-containing protein [Rhodospirillaceae bacterium]MBT4701590.1 ATP-binding cassette domain-containing protein [Rhodospirillaceae bacterium]MBT5036238.1 ATP-binding cassette domain-containing protein [Rhodospirillaceae bacterium]MBT6221628.1 ATP-binding cassette domain-containing protein [Rhodospirillaceae bacterium]
MINVSGLRKSFGSVTALDGINFKAQDGEVTGLIGPNGAGKTTALRILYTVMQPDSGAAEIDDFDTVSHRQEVQRRIGVLPDSRGLYPRLTAREHIRYYGRLHGMGGKALEAQIDTLVEALGMGEFADRRAKGFSKGQVRKVALARAMVHEPKNLLLDEPTNGLDIASSRAVHQLIRDLKSKGCCVLFCSHIMREVAAISDRIVVLSSGQVVAQGTADELSQQTGESDLEEMFLSVTGSQEGW